MKDNLINNNELLTEEPVRAEEEELKFRRPKKIIKRKRALIVLLVILGVALIAALSFAAYKIFSPEEEYDDSASFYFDSDFLPEGEVHEMVDSIEFKLYNYEDSLRVSKEAISDVVIKINAGGEDITSKTEISMGNPADMKPNVRSGCAVSVSLPKKYYNEVIEVSVTSLPVKKELKGYFKVLPAWDYSIEDSEENICAYLVISANKDVCLELSWDAARIIADSTNSYVKTAEDGENKCIVELTAGASTAIPLFKNDPLADYSEDNTVISLAVVKKAVSDKKTDETTDTEAGIQETDTEAEEVNA